MELELEEIQKRKDYKLNIVWGCIECYPENRWNRVNIYLHRTTDEYEENMSNVKQVCLKKHITRPFKMCSKCDTRYELEEIDCPICDVYVNELTRIEVSIENSEKDIQRLKSQLKKGRITKDNYLQQTSEIEQEILLHKEERVRLEEEDSKKNKKED